MSSHDLVMSEQLENGVCLLTLNRPEAYNAISNAMQERLDAALKACERDEEIRVIVLTGAGAKAFSAGYDVKELEAYDEDEMLVNYTHKQQWLGYLAFYSKPLICAVNGVAHGAGAIIAAASDIRVGGPSTDFRFTAAPYGGVNNTWQLPHIVGFAKAMEFVMTGRRIGAQELFEAGLLNHVVPDDEIVGKAIEIAALIAANPARAVQWHKKLIHDHVGRSYQDSYEAENTIMNTVMRPTRPAKIFEKFLASHPKS